MINEIFRQIVILLALCGTTLILTRGWILAGFRARFEDHEYAYEFVRCPLCAGAWVGGIGWLLIGTASGELGLLLLVESVVVGLAVSFISAAVGGADARG